MHQGRPYGLHVVGGELTGRDEAFVSVTAKRFGNLKDILSIDSSRMVYDLPDGGYIVIQDMGNNFRVIAHKSSKVLKNEANGLAVDYIPMLFSGVVVDATPFETEGATLRLTETTRRRLIDYDPNREPVIDEIDLHRFRIEYDFKFKYFEPQNKGAKTFTQYHKLRATWYSGAMSEVMQTIGGYGRQDIDDLPDDEIERKVMRLPPKVSDAVRAHIANQRLPAYDGVPDFEGKYKYEYRHGLCHGVSFDEAGKPWLLQISPTGVYVMPLPIIPATTAPAFREYLQEVNDDELLHLVDRFGGMPSGELFPTGDDFQSWLRAGVIIKVCDTNDFYKYNAFYTACGWAFNNQGTEAFNTCWSGGVTSQRYAYGFKMRLRLGAARNHGWVLNARLVGTEDVLLVNRYIGALFEAMNGNGHRERAMRYKVMSTPIDDLLRIARSQVVDVDYWDNMTSPPIAIHEGSVSQVSKGALYWPSKNPLSFGLLKFPEYAGQGCASFDMSMPEYEGPSANCDTVVFGCYVNDQLTVVKYFYDPRGFKSTIDKESTFEDIMIVGEWEETVTTSTSGLMGYLYTTAFDDRREVSDRVTYTKIIGSDLGYGNPAFSTPSLLYTTGGLSRYRYYSHLTKKTITSGTSMSVATCVPVFCRDSILYAYQESSSSKSYSEKLEKLSVADPTSYSIWTYDPIFHYMGGTGRGDPRPTIGQFVYANYDPDKNYRPTASSWFADSGNWYNVPANSFVDVSSIVSKYTIRGNTYNANGVVIGGEAPQLDTYSIANTTYGDKSGRVSVSIQVKGAATIHKDIPSAFYYDFSPVDSGGSLVYFYRDATWIACGTQRYSNTDEIKQNDIRAYWGSTKLADHKSAHCFIGVINE